MDQIWLLQAVENITNLSISDDWGQFLIALQICGSNLVSVFSFFSWYCDLVCLQIWINSCWCMWLWISNLACGEMSWCCYCSEDKEDIVKAPEARRNFDGSLPSGTPTTSTCHLPSKQGWSCLHEGFLACHSLFMSCIVEWYHQNWRFKVPATQRWKCCEMFLPIIFMSVDMNL